MFILFYFFSFHLAAIKLVQPSLLVFSCYVWFDILLLLLFFGLIFYYYYYYYYFNLLFLNWYQFCISFFHCKISWEDFIRTVFIYLNLSKIFTTRKESTSEDKIPSQKFKYCRKRLLARAYVPRRPQYLLLLQKEILRPYLCKQIIYEGNSSSLLTKFALTNILPNDEKSR